MMKQFLAGLLLLTASCVTADPQPVLVTIKRNYAPIPKDKDKVTIAIDWNNLLKRVPELKNTSPVVTDRNFGREVSAKSIDTNNDDEADYLVFDYTFQSNEPIFSFLIAASKNKASNPVKENITPDKRLEVSFLKPFDPSSKKGKLSIASQVVQSTLNFYPDPKDFPIYAPNRWNYEYSFFLLGSFELSRNVDNSVFAEYPKRWIDGFINETGGLRCGSQDQLL